MNSTRITQIIMPHVGILEFSAHLLSLLPEQEIEYVNGCGTDGWLGYLVPESYHGVSFRAACLQHDYDYYIGDCWKDKVAADAKFHRNLIRLIETADDIQEIQARELQRRYDRANLYAWSVTRHGEKAFVAGRNQVLSAGEIIRNLPPIEDIIQNGGPKHSLGTGDIY